LFVDTLAILLVPAMIGLIMVAPDAVRVILAPADNPTKWDGAIKPLIWLSCYMIVSILGSLVTQVLTSRRMTKMTMRVALINLAIMPVAFIIGARLWGTTGVAAAWLIASPLTALPSAIVLLRRIGARLERVPLDSLAHSLRRNRDGTGSSGHPAGFVAICRCPDHPARPSDCRGRNRLQRRPADFFPRKSLAICEVCAGLPQRQSGSGRRNRRRPRGIMKPITPH